MSEEMGQLQYALEGGDWESAGTWLFHLAQQDTPDAAAALIQIASDQPSEAIVGILEKVYDRDRTEETANRILAAADEVSRETANSLLSKIPRENPLYKKVLRQVGPG